MRRAVALAVASLMAVSACGGPESGMVVDRVHEAGEWDKQTVCKKTGKKSRSCKTTRVWDAPEWQLTIRSAADSGDVEVTQDEYDACPPKSRWPDCAR